MPLGLRDAVGLRETAGLHEAIVLHDAGAWHLRRRGTELFFSTQCFA